MVPNPCNPSPLSVFNPLSLAAPGATAKSCPLGSLRSGTVRLYSQMSHCSGFIYFLLTFCLHIALLRLPQIYEGDSKKIKIAMT